MIAARFRLDEIGEDESIDFLRHQLQTRHSDDEGRGIPPVLFRASAAFAVVAAIGIGAVVAIHYIETPRPMTATVAAPPPPAATLPPPAAVPPQPVATPTPAATALSAAASSGEPR